MPLRLGLDIGSSSIGWWLYELAEGRPVRVVDGGVRIFSDGRDAKTGASLAVDRRIARGMRRRRDRYLRRRAALMRRMAVAGLMPSNPTQAKELQALDPFELRARGLEEKLPLTHLGRALFHLNQRRGFKSNRKADAGDNEGGKIADGSARLDQAMMTAGARSYGEFLHKRREAAPDAREIPAVRTRLTLRRDEDGKDQPGYDFYPDRRHLESEFALLWDRQARFHPELPDDLRDTIFETIFYQRPLKAPAVGRCLFFDEPRLPRAHPLTQRRVLYETVNNLKITAPGVAARPLKRDERDKIIVALDGKKPAKTPGATKITLTSLAKTLKLAPGQAFTLASAVRDAIACDPVRAALAHPDRFGPQWSALDDDAQWRLIRRLRDEQDAIALHDWLKQEYGFDDTRADAVTRAPLPEGYSRLGETATRNILAALQGDVLTYDKAVAFCGLHHSDHRTGEVLTAHRPEDAQDHEWPLPYYGEILDRHVIPGTQDPGDDDITRWGRITNPTVHIGLNQLRRLVNRIINTYGLPDQIVVELARELKQSEDQKKADIKRINDNTRAAQQRSRKLAELGIADTGENRMKLRLWEDMAADPLQRVCPYTGTQISVSMLFSGACDIDHILPFSQTLDDSIANRTWCMREANRQKRNQTPYQAFHATALWPGIEARLKHIPEFRRWRFAPDAMARYQGERDFIARALTDTQYLSRIARQYLDALFTEGGHVWVVPGRLTERLRRHWGLNSLLHDPARDVTKAKNRMDHRHHAVDAAVIAATDRSLIKIMADLARAPEANGREVQAHDTPPPFDGFRDAVRAQIDRITVSHRADHGRIDPAARLRGRDSTTGRLHNDTAYGLTGEQERGVTLVVTRKPFASLTPAMIEKIRDPLLASALRAATHGKDGTAFTAALSKFSTRSGPYKGIRHVRIIEPVGVIEIRDAQGGAYKGYRGGSNHCYEVWRLPDGKLTHHVVGTFEAHQGTASRPHPAAKRLLRLFKNDMVRLEDSKFGPLIATVEKFDGNGTIEMIAHNESNADARYRKDKEDIYIRMRAGPLVKAGARRVLVDELGRISDPRLNS